MIKNLYTASGWVNIPAIRQFMTENKIPFLFCWGGRGIGKTYGALKDARERAIADPEGKHKFMLVRRMQSQVDIISKQELSPFKRIDLDHGFFTECKPVSKFTTGFWSDETLLGYVAALSTFSNLRGFDASDVDLIVFDEFIPESHEKPIRNEHAALLNLYETVNRNRELNGMPACLLMCYANSNNISNAIFSGLGLIDTVDNMQRKHRQSWVIRDRGILLLNLNASPISLQKSKTALYRLAGSQSDYSQMALSNSFRSDTGSKIGSRNISEYIPLITVGALCIYEHKQNGTYYVCDLVSGSPETYGANKTELLRFKSQNIWLWREYMRGNIVFRSLEIEIMFQNYFKT